jgi:hypothetical protein
VKKWHFFKNRYKNCEKSGRQGFETTVPNRRRVLEQPQVIIIEDNRWTR